MGTWQHELERRRVHSRRMETLTSFPPEVKNGPFLENFSPHSPFSILREDHKGVSHLSPQRNNPIGSSFSSFSILREPILRPRRRCDNPYYFLSWSVHFLFFFPQPPANCGREWKLRKFPFLLWKNLLQTLQRASSSLLYICHTRNQNLEHLCVRVYSIVGSTLIKHAHFARVVVAEFT